MVIPEATSQVVWVVQCACNAPCWREPQQLQKSARRLETGEACWSSRWREARGSASALHWYCQYCSERLFTIVLPGNVPAEPVKKSINVEKKNERAFNITGATATSAENSSISLYHNAHSSLYYSITGNFVWFNSIIRYVVKWNDTDSKSFLSVERRSHIKSL